MRGRAGEQEARSRPSFSSAAGAACSYVSRLPVQQRLEQGDGCRIVLLRRLQLDHLHHRLLALRLERQCLVERLRAARAPIAAAEGRARTRRSGGAGRGKAGRGTRPPRLSARAASRGSRAQGHARGCAHRPARALPGQGCGAARTRLALSCAPGQLRWTRPTSACARAEFGMSWHASRAADSASRGRSTRR